MELKNIIEALLFVLGESVSVGRLASLTEKTPEEISEALKALESDLAERGIRLVFLDEQVGLVSAPEASDFISRAIKEEFSGDLTKAALETLAVVLYKGPLSRSEVDYIRGVNSSFSLRNLLVRGLIERVSDPSDRRIFLYKPGMELLKFFGVSHIEDIPQYNEVRKKLEEFVKELPQKSESFDSVQEKPFD